MTTPIRTRSAEVHETAAASAARADVLIVDADDDSRALYRDVLGARRIEVAEAADGREGLVRALALGPRVIVIDARLPYIDGLELCALLQNDPLTETARVVVITSDGSPAHLGRCHQRGAAAVLVKPVLMAALTATVEKLRSGVERGAAGPDAAGAMGTTPAAVQRPARVRLHERYVSTTPPEPPPQLRCPACDVALHYDRSHIGGVSGRYPEQWDYYVCPTHGTFQYRHRTRKLRPAS